MPRARPRRGSSLTLGVSAPQARFTFKVVQKKTNPARRIPRARGGFGDSGSGLGEVAERIVLPREVGPGGLQASQVPANV